MLTDIKSADKTYPDVTIKGTPKPVTDINASIVPTLNYVTEYVEDKTKDFVVNSNDFVVKEELENYAPKEHTHTIADFPSMSSKHFINLVCLLSTLLTTNSLKANIGLMTLSCWLLCLQISLLRAI